MRLVLENAAPVLKHLRIQIFMYLVSALFLQQSVIAVVPLLSELPRYTAEQIPGLGVERRGGETPFSLTPDQEKQMNNSRCHTEVFSETSPRYV